MSRLVCADGIFHHKEINSTFWIFFKTNSQKSRYNHFWNTST